MSTDREMKSTDLTTPSGLVWGRLIEGAGASPKSGDTVLIHYEIWVGSGATSSEYDYATEKYADQIYDRTDDEVNPFAGPIEITIGQKTPLDETYTKGDSIVGLDEALLTMKVGEKRRLLIPSELAYGQLGGSSFHTFHGYRTPPATPIRCNVELVGIKKEK